VKKLPWPSREGFDDYNDDSRNLLGIAYRDGQRPHLIVERSAHQIQARFKLASGEQER
jgi:hypothetical protein